MDLIEFLKQKKYYIYKKELLSNIIIAITNFLINYILNRQNRSFTKKSSEHKFKTHIIPFGMIDLRHNKTLHFNIFILTL